MKATRKLRRGWFALMALVIAYTGIVAYTTWSSRRDVPYLVVNREFFPFFSWSLFSSPSRYAERTTIVPREVSPDSPLKDALNRAIRTDEAPFMRDIRFQKLSRSFTRAVQRNQEKNIRERAALIAGYVEDFGIRSFDVMTELRDPLIRDRDNLLEVNHVWTIDLEALE